jgi:hypothetical protein
MLYREENISKSSRLLKQLIDKHGYDKGVKAYNGLGKGPTEDYTGRIKSVIKAIKGNKEMMEIIGNADR